VQTNELAGWMGVGRGADLVFYCWIVISLIVSVNLYFKIQSLQEVATELTRELALRAPHEPRGIQVAHGSKAEQTSMSDSPKS